MAKQFRVALTADSFDSDGQPVWENMGLDILESVAGLSFAPLAEKRPVVGPDQLVGVQALLVMGSGVDAETVSRSEDLILLSRFGVGYDKIDVEACTEADVALTITAGAVNRSVAEATVGWMIALTHHVLIKDRIVRTGDWDTRTAYPGRELRDRTLGVVGLGRIAEETLRLLGSFGMQPPLAFDPHVNEDTAKSLGVRVVDLDTLLSTADFVSLHCPLTDETRGLIGKREIAMMKPDAYLINTARGGIVDENALYEALDQGTIAGAALDCFAEEPLTEPSRFRTLDNILLAPHSIAWTRELFRDVGRMACQATVDFATGKTPAGVVNPEVLDKPSFQEKWARLRLTS